MKSQKKRNREKMNINCKKLSEYHTIHYRKTNKNKTHNGFAIHICSNYEKKPLKMVSGQMQCEQ